MKKSTIIYLIIITLNIVFFKKTESFLLNWGFSWTSSKLFPYLTLIILGFLIGGGVKKRFNLRKYLSFLLYLIIAILPFFVGFIFNPIYQGDFSKNGTIPKINALPKEFKNIDLVVITIPGCPFCHESTFNSNIMLKRNPKLKIKYIVCSDSSKETEPYRMNLDSKIEVVLSSDPKNMSAIAQGSFPSFILFKNNKAIEQWSNDQFGVRAKDFVEKN